jgi:xanthine dehydrogenase YagS FAD-binding subunit
MNSFTYFPATSTDQAVGDYAAHPQATYLAGGTNLIDNIKLNILQPQRLIDVRKIGSDQINSAANGGLSIGALVTNSALAYDQRVQQMYPVLSQAILAGASPQLRNVATTAGNLLQRTRCYYFRDASSASPCNKRSPGSGCAAIDGFNRIHAVLGTSDKCIATHPSDMDVALMALDAVVITHATTGNRSIPIADFYVAYGEDPARENVLQPGELITAVELPPTAWFARSQYTKARDRASYEFALASAAVALDVDNSVIRDCRIALGGIATKPWRALAAEKVIRGQKQTDDLFHAAAEAELQHAIAQKFNGFKIEMAKRILVGTLKKVAAQA